MEDGPDYDGPDYDYADPNQPDPRENTSNPQGENFGYDMQGNRVVLRPGEKIQGNYAYTQEGRRWIGPKELDPDYVWDDASKKILAELTGLASGSIESEAEKETKRMGGMLATGTQAVAKSRRGVAPGAAFSEAAQQTGMISNITRTAAAGIKKDVMGAAEQDRLSLIASKEAEKRGISLGYQQMVQQAELAAKSARAGLFGSFISALGSIGAAFLIGSDQRIKTSIDPEAGRVDLMDFLNNLESATYAKHMYGLVRNETGIMAQSAERSKVGRQFVHEVDGVKRLDPNAALNPILGSLKLLHERIGELETTKPKKKKRSKK